MSTSRTEERDPSPIGDRTQNIASAGDDIISNYSSTEFSRVVLDSSAIASIFFMDRYGREVETIIRGYDRLLTVDIAYAELGSVAWKSIIIFKEKLEPVSKALDQANEFLNESCYVIPSSHLVKDAFEIGIKHKVQVYDTLFLSLASKTKSRVLTTDERLHNRLKGIEQLRGMTFLPTRRSKEE